MILKQTCSAYGLFCESMTALSSESLLDYQLKYAKINLECMVYLHPFVYIIV